MSNELTANPVFTTDEVVTGMCLWEAMLNLTGGPADDDEDGPMIDEDEDEDGDIDANADAVLDPCEVAQEMLDGHGSFTIRSALVDLVKPCEAGWKADRMAKGDDGAQYDWDWCPAFLRASLVDGTLQAAIERQYQPQ